MFTMTLSVKARFWMKLSVVLAVIAVGSLLAFRSGADWSRWTPQELRARILAWGAWAPVGFMLAYTLRVFVLIPASMMTLAGGLLFGPWWGTLYTVTGATMCAAIEFGVARWVGREAIERWLTGRVRLARLDDMVAQRGFLAVLLARIVPSVPFEVANVSLGLSPVRWRDYLLATMVGMVPWTIAFGFLGEAITDFRSFGKVLLGILAVVLLIWGPWLWRRRRAQSP